MHRSGWFDSPGDGERHPVGLQGAATDEDGVRISPQFQEPGVIRA